MNRTISAVAVSYNSANLACRAMSTLYPYIRASNGHILVADNASPLGDCDLLKKVISRQGWSDTCAVIKSPINGGFGAGNNFAFHYLEKMGTLPDFIYLFNPDTEFTEDPIRKMLALMDENPKVGVVGNQLVSELGDIHVSAFNYPTATREFFSSASLGVFVDTHPERLIAPPQRVETYKTDWVAGASVLIRRAALESYPEVFDESFFLYYEEVDLMRRIKMAGWDIVYSPESQVVHLEGQSSGISKVDGGESRIPDYWFESWRHYYVKNHGQGYAIAAGFFRLAGLILAFWHLGIRGHSTQVQRAGIRDVVCRILIPLLTQR